jgi:hypothetical protein
MSVNLPKDTEKDFANGYYDDDEFYEEGYIPVWKKYPVERCVMRKEKQERFAAKCKKLGKPKSRVINDLLDLWLDDKVKV